MSEFNFLFLIASFVTSLIFALIFVAGFHSKYQKRLFSGCILHGIAAALFIYLVIINAEKVIFSLLNRDSDVIMSASLCSFADRETDYLPDGRCIYRNVELQADAFENDFLILETADLKMLVRSELIQIIR